MSHDGEVIVAFVRDARRLTLGDVPSMWPRSLDAMVFAPQRAAVVVASQVGQFSVGAWSEPLRLDQQRE